MSIAVSAEGVDLEAAVDPRFGRCPQYVFVDPETLDFEAISNAAAAEFGGAGVRAAELAIKHGAEAVITGNVGPNAQRVLEAAGVPIYLMSDGTVGEAIEAYLGNRLALSTTSTGRGRSPGGRRGSGERNGTGPADRPAPGSPSPDRA